MYADILEGCLSGYTGLIEADNEAKLITPAFHTPEFIKQMKRRLYTKNPKEYERWAELGTSEDNYYWSPAKRAWLMYRNGKLLETII